MQRQEARMSIVGRRASDAGDLKALGHPLRLALLDLLLASGPLTATEAAGLLAQTPANVSWHLRRLAEQGFVRQATSGPGRRRPWKAVTRALASDPAADLGPANAATEVQLDRELQLLRFALAAERADPSESYTRIDRRRIWLSPDEASALGRDLAALVASYAGLHDGADAADQRVERRPVAVVSWLVPVGEPPRGRHAREE
jgi:DNA-binding transcriptional ArsR family regulator